MNTKSKKPMIELYMYSLHQEFPEGVSHAAFLERHVDTRDILTAAGQTVRSQQVTDRAHQSKADDWPAEWLHAKWVTDHTKAITGVFERADASPLRIALTRTEPFGGIIYDPFSDKVYKVNESGFRLFREIQAENLRGAKLESFASKEFATEDVKEFCAFLRGADLWER